MPEPDSPSPQTPPPPEALKSALKAFRKRLKLTQLDDDSRLGGHGAMTGGRRSEIKAIRPPDPERFPQAVWDELVKQGKLKCVGHGLYHLIEP